MRDKRNRLWNRWDINKFRSINDDSDTNLYISELRLSEDNDTTIPDVNNGNRNTINWSVHSDGRLRILCTIRRGTNTDVLYNRSVRSKRAENHSGILFLFLYAVRISSDVNKYNVHIHNKWNNRLCDTNGI